MKNSDEVRDIVSAIRLNPLEFRKIHAIAKSHGLSFAATVRMLALQQAAALQEQQQNARQRAA